MIESINPLWIAMPHTYLQDQRICFCFFLPDHPEFHRFPSACCIHLRCYWLWRFHQLDICWYTVAKQSLGGGQKAWQFPYPILQFQQLFSLTPMFPGKMPVNRQSWNQATRIPESEFFCCIILNTHHSDCNTNRKAICNWSFSKNAPPF